MKRLARIGCCAVFSCLVLGASDANTLHLKVVAVRSDTGATVEDLSLRDWSIKIDGKEQMPVSQRGPAEISSQAQSWALVFLPIESPEFRKMALLTATKFMESLPSGDRVLVVVGGANGLECLTPGFTRSTTLWVKALEHLKESLPAGLRGDYSKPFVLPPSPASEPEEDRKALRNFESQLIGRDLNRQLQDVSGRHSLAMQYAPTSLGGYSQSVKKVLVSLEQMGQVLSRVGSEKQIAIFSRNEIDDLANPAWTQIKSAYNSREPVNNPRLQIELMIGDIASARKNLQSSFASSGVVLHSVGGTTPAYGGAFSEIVTALGGQNFRFDNSLPDRFSAVLASWAAHYDILIPVPQGQERPQKVAVSCKRSGVRIIAPTLQ